MIPKICKETMTLTINDQFKVTLFPKSNGQPKVDIITLDFTQIEGNKVSLYLTPDEALEIIGALASTVQMYLYNQEQYRTDILKPKEKLAKQREKSCANRKPGRKKLAKALQ